MLRAIQESEIRRIGENRPISVDIRVIAATNVDLGQAVEERRFRQDLFYRLNVARFHLPPLRDRREDISLLADFFLEKYNRKMNARSNFGDGIIDLMMTYDYPGNVRELENMVEQAVALSSGVSSLTMTCCLKRQNARRAQWARHWPTSWTTLNERQSSRRFA